MCNMRLAITFLAILMQESISLRVVEVVVPGYKVRGENALLECRYDLERENLYSVRWYKDDEEFYRFLPKQSPPLHSFRTEGVKVDHYQSDDKKVTLKSVSLKTSGIFRCEVSAEAPSFASAHAESRMEVVYLPKDGPHISGQEKEYQTGDTLKLNCTSGRSFPPSTLDWFINEAKVSSVKEIVKYPEVKHAHGLVTSILGLRVVLRPWHFAGGVLRARCHARVLPALWNADRDALLERASSLLDDREALLLVKSGCDGGGYQKSRWLPIIICVVFFILNVFS